MRTSTCLSLKGEVMLGAEENCTLIYIHYKWNYQHHTAHDRLKLPRFSPLILLTFHTSLFLPKMFACSLLLRGESNPQCLQGQTGALANMVCHRIISTINFRLGHQLASSQTRSAGGGVPPAKANISRCLTSHIPTAAHFLLAVQLRFAP